MSEDSVYDWSGVGPDGWAPGQIISKSDRSYTKEDGKGIVVRKTHARSFSEVLSRSLPDVLYGECDCTYENPRVGDIVKIRTRRVRSEETNPRFFVRTIQVTKVTETKVIGTYVSDEYDQRFLGDRVAATQEGTVVYLPLQHINPKPVVGEILHTVIQTEIVLVERGSES